MNRDAFLEGATRAAARVTHYENGKDGSDGGCDCIGLVKAAVKMGGGWISTAGTNDTARNKLHSLDRISGTGSLSAGEVVLKSREKGESGWDLPSKYWNGEDMRDYYHIGIVAGVNPLSIVHCTTVPGGIQWDQKIGNWKWHGLLKCIEDKGKEGKRMVIQSKNGKGANLRSEPRKNSRLIEVIPDGATVDVLEEGPYYTLIGYLGTQGYVLNTLLREEDAGIYRPGDETAEDPDTYTGNTGKMITLTMDEATVIKIFNAVNDALIKG